jgi:hypothetical protein
MKGVPTAARSIFLCPAAIRGPLLFPVIAIVPYPAVPRNVTEVIFALSRGLTEAIELRHSRIAPSTV